MKPGANSANVLATAIVSIPLGTLAVALRLYTRKYLLKQVWIDDYLAIASWFCLLCVIGANFEMVASGLGSHLDQIPADGVPRFFRDLWIGLVIYNTCLLFTKSTMLFQLYRIIRSTHWRWRKWAYFSTIVLIASWQFSQIIITIFTCYPPQGVWDTTVHGHCLDITLLRILNSGSNIVTDLVILLLPLPIIWHLKLPWRETLALVVIFGIGIFTCIIAANRVVNVITVSEHNNDVAWQTSSVVAWTTAEVLTGILVAALSTLRPLATRYMIKKSRKDPNQANPGVVRSLRFSHLRSLFNESHRRTTSE